MNLWYKKASLFIVSGVVYIVGQYFRGFWWPYLTWPFPCHIITFGTSTYCDPLYLETLGWPLITLGQMLAIVALILLFADAISFRKWLKFSYWFVPIAALIVILVFPIPMPLGTALSRERAVYNFGELYAIITFGILLWHSFSVRKRANH